MDGNNVWQKGVLKVDRENDYMKGDYHYFSYDGIAYFVSPCIEMVNNGSKCCHMYLFYIPDGDSGKGRYVKTGSIEWFTPMFKEDDYNVVH